jgi:hypothetical protein
MLFGTSATILQACPLLLNLAVGAGEPWLQLDSDADALSAGLNLGPRKKNCLSVRKTTSRFL